MPFTVKILAVNTHPKSLGLNLQRISSPCDMVISCWVSMLQRFNYYNTLKYSELQFSTNLYCLLPIH